MKINIFKLIVLLQFSLFITSCSMNELDKVDTNTQSPTKISLELLLPNAQMSMVNLSVASKYSQWLSTYIQHTVNTRINVMPPIENSGSFWNDSYLNLMNLKELKERSEADQRWNYAAISKILTVVVLGNLTDTYGDIPYKEALQGSFNRAPNFDSQESIYLELQKLLDDAIVDLNKKSSLPTNDLILKGDTSLWRKTAWALKARYDNRLSNIDPQGSATNSLNAISKSFTANSQGCSFKSYLTGSININPFTGSEKREQQFGACKTLLDVMNGFNGLGYDDPRALWWFNKIKGKIVGGIGGDNKSDQKHLLFSGLSMTNTLADNASMPIITYSEIKFIEAEANLRLSKPAEAYSAYQAAVRAACSSSGIAIADIDAYVAQGTVFPGEANLTIESIIKQKYISCFPFQTLEAFNDYRRTGLPALNNPTNVIKRLAYPGAELERNPNAPKDINEVTMYLNKVWWALN